MVDNLIEIFELPLFEVGGQSITLLWIVQLCLALIVVSLAASLTKRFLKNRILAQIGIGGGNRESISTLISIGLGAFGYIAVLQASGINLSSLAVIIGALGVGIGFGLQDITKNLLSGLTILVERKLKVGDFIEFDDIEGYIEEIAIRSTVIQTLTGGQVIIPNSQLAEERVINWCYRNRQGRIEMTVGVAYGSDPVLVTEVLLEAAYDLPEILLEPKPKVIFSGFGESALNFQLRAWMNNIDNRDTVKSNLTFMIEYYFRRNQISVPFPQLDLWMRSSQNSDSPLPLISPSLRKNNEEAQPHPPPTNLTFWLSKISYFQKFNELQMRSLIEMGYRKYLSTSEILIHQGELAREFCIVLTGSIGAFHESDCQEKQLFTFSGGEYFGELPLMLGVPYPTSMKALTETVLFMIDASGFQKLLKLYPALADEIAQELASRKEILDGYQQELEKMGFKQKGEKNTVVWIRQRLQEFFTKLSV